MRRLILALSLIASAAQAAVVDRIVVVVGGEAITERDQRTDGRPLDDLIDDKLIVAEATRRHLSVSSEEIGRALEEVMRSNNLTEEQLWQAVAAQHFTKDGYRRRLGQQLLDYKLLNVLASLQKPDGPEDSQARLARLAQIRKAQLATTRANTAIERHSVGTAPTTPPIVCRKATSSVTAIEVRGPHRVDGKGICAAIRHQAGVAVDPERAHQDLLALWNTGVFDDVGVEANGSVLSYVVHERPLVSRVSYSENPALGTLEMHTVSSLRVGEVAAPTTVQRAANRLTDELVERGYQRAAVKGEVRPDGPDLVRVHFEITPGPQLTIGTLRLAGNQRVTTDELMRTIGRSTHRLRVGSVYRTSELEAAMQTLLAYYYDHGMVQARIDAAPPETAADSTVTVEIRITEGPVFHLGTIRFAGTRGAPANDARYAAAAALTSGAIFSRSEVRDALARIDAVHHELGGSGSATPETSIHDDRVDILWRLEP